MMKTFVVSLLLRFIDSYEESKIRRRKARASRHRIKAVDLETDASIIATRRNKRRGRRDRPQ